MLAMGQFGPTLTSSVQPDSDIDDHAIHMQTIKAFLVSDVGQQVKAENPMGFENCLAHYRMHQEAGMMQMMQQQAMAGAQDPNSEAPGDEEQPAVEVPQGV
jgi:hypothetical protein